MAATNAEMTRRHPLRHSALLALLALVLLLASATPALAISRDTVLKRAQTWMDVLVPYSQTTYYKGYRTDCSGYVSMSWQAGYSWSTRSFHAVSAPITVEELQPGDAIHKIGHIRLFYGWLDDSHTHYVCYEQTGPTLKSSIRAIADDLAAGYHPCRYERIADSAPSRNLLRNPAFNVWVKPWGSTLPAPVWWTVDGSTDTTLALRRMDVSRSGRNSFELVNSSSSPTAWALMSQTVTVTPETTYAVYAWVRSASDPGALRVSIDYLNTGGASVARVRTYGTSWPLVPDAFRQVAFVLASPPDAVRARVVVRLAGGESVVGTETVAGTSAILDDVALVRPYSTVTIKRSRSSAYIGNKVTLSGSLAAAPASAAGTAAVGQPYTVLVQKPGSSVWQAHHVHTTYVSAGAAVWKCAYTFKRGMKKGMYRFKVEVPPFGDFLGSTSSTITVTLR